MRWLWLVIALAGCRQVFGIDEPLPGGGVVDASTDGHAGFLDGPAAPTAGLAMYVESGVALWTNDQPPEIAWALTDPTNAKAEVWSGEGPDITDLVFSGDIDPQQPFSVWMEGQINVPQGPQQVQITASDYAFFDIELAPNSGSFQQVVSSRNDMTQMRAITVQTTGWYRVRIGWASMPATADLSILHAGGNNPTSVAFNVTNLRH